MRFLSVLVVGFLVGSIPSPLVGQQLRSHGIDAAVVRYLSSGYGAADIAIDPKELVRDSTLRLSPRANLARAKAVAAALGTRTAARADVIACGGRPRLCRLVGAAMHLQLGAPQIVDSTAAVVVLQHFTTGDARMPMAYRRLRLFLVLRNGVWHVQRQEIQVLS